MLLLAQTNAMFRSKFFPKLKTIPLEVHLIYSGLNVATARAILFAGVTG